MKGYSKPYAVFAQGHPHIPAIFIKDLYGNISRADIDIKLL